MQASKRQNNARNAHSSTPTNNRTCMGTPYPETRPTTPRFRTNHVKRVSYDALEVATAVAAASTTPSIGKQIRINVEQLSSTAAKRAQLYKDIKEAPERFFNRINMTNIADKTWKDVERSKAGPIRTKDTKGKMVSFAKPPRKPKPAKNKKSTNRQRGKADKTLTVTTSQLFEIIRDMMAPAAVSNALDLAMEPTLDIPLFAPNIQPAPLPAITTNNQPQLNLDALLIDDIDMGDVETIGNGDVHVGGQSGGSLENDFIEISVGGTETVTE